MATVAGTGQSTLRDAAEAGREAARRALVPLDGAPPDLCLLFGAASYDQSALLAGVREITGEGPLCGCSGEGVIVGSESIEGDRGVAVMALRSDRIQFATFLVPGYAGDPVAAGRELARRVNTIGARHPLALLVFPDGLSGNCDALLRALDGAIPGAPVVAGGTAGDALTFTRTFQYHGAAAATGAVAAVLVHGDGRVAVAVSHGCEPIGRMRSVTRASGGWLYEIDGRPAWSVFQEYLHGEPTDLNAEGITHLCLGEEVGTGDHSAGEPDQRYIIRTPLQLDQGNGALFFPGGGFATGAMIRMTRRDPDRIRESARACASRIAAIAGGSLPAFVLQFDCAGRGRVLFGSCAADEIVRPLQEAVGASTPWVGFHTYGEIAPWREHPRYHNYTVALCAVFDGS